MQDIKNARHMLFVDLLLYLLYLMLFLLATLLPFSLLARDSHQLIATITSWIAPLALPDPSVPFSAVASVGDFWSFWKGPLRCAPRLSPAAQWFGKDQSSSRVWQQEYTRPLAGFSGLRNSGSP